MTKVYFNNSEIQKTVMPSLIDTINVLTKTSNAAQSLNTPSSFSKASILNNLPSFLNNIQKDLTNVKEWLITSNRKYEEAIANIETIVNNIDDVAIDKRNKIVNNIKSSI